MANGPGFVVYVHVTPPCLQLVHGSFLSYFLLFIFSDTVHKLASRRATLHFGHQIVRYTSWLALANTTILYRAAVALHSSLRFAYFERVWKDSPDGHGEIKRARAATKLFFKAYLQSTLNQSCYRSL